MPSWTPTGTASGRPTLINAREETILELPSFSRALKRTESRRCVVVTTGFYEWYKGPGPRPEKIPYLVTRAGDVPVLLLAGVYDEWRSPDSEEPLLSFAIATRKATEQFTWLHDRQPCFLSDDQDVRDWLDYGRLSGEQAVQKVLRGESSINTRLSWRRMTADLSKESQHQGKPLVSKNIRTFFAPVTECKQPSKLDAARGSKRKAASLHMQDKPQATSAFPKEPSVSRSPAKRKKSDGGKVPSTPPHAGQRSITSFFGKKP